MAIVVEVRTASQHGATRQRFSDEALAAGVSVGRGYYCDVIVDDPHVAAEEVRISLRPSDPPDQARPDGGQLWLEPVGDGVVRLGGQQLVSARSVASGTQLKLGRSTISLFDEGHAVAPTAPLDLLLERVTSLARPVSLLVVTIAVYLLILADEAAGQLAERDWLDAGLSALTPLFLAVLWSSVWALVTRVLRHEARFQQHLLVAIVSVALSVLMSLMSELAQFNSQDVRTGQWLDPILLGLLLCFAFALHVRIIAGPMRWYSHAVIAGLAWAFVGYGVLEDSNRSRDFQAWPEYSSVLLPPKAYLGSAETLPGFIEGLSESFDRAADSRTMAEGDVAEERADPKAEALGSAASQRLE